MVCVWLVGFVNGQAVFGLKMCGRITLLLPAFNMLVLPVVLLYK